MPRASCSVRAARSGQTPRSPTAVPGETGEQRPASAPGWRNSLFRIPIVIGWLTLAATSGSADLLGQGAGLGSQAGSQPAPQAPFWANNGRISYGLQGAFGFQTPVPPRGEHIKLLYAQPQLEVNLLRFNRGPVGRFDWLSEGLVGGAVSPAARIIGYSLLFRLEGRTRGNTKPILDFGAGVNNTTLDQHAYELTGGLQFTPQGGLGIEHYFSPQHAIVFEYRFFHMSNNGIREPNHGFNAAVFSVGFRWLRRPTGPKWR
ncbi:MAG TPA: acyloxyacyl hydrolase [Terriglobia bacterium]|nr:acyloxyacyl hydrolase [Terriglobia bacterium]